MEATNIFFSILIATFKRNQWLEECLASVEQSIKNYQHSGGTELMEILVCDDDPNQQEFDYQKWNSRFSALNTKFIYLVNKENQGDYFNRNTGIIASSGKWIKFIDDDDTIYDWSISFIIDKLKLAIEPNVVIFYLRDNFRHLHFPVELKNEEIFKFHYLEYGLFHCSLVSAVFLKEDMLKVGGFKFKRFYGDFQIFHEMARNGCFSIYPLELGWYRMHEAQESNNNRKSAQIRFNYLLYSFNYLVMMESVDSDKYMKKIKNESYAFLKHAIKKIDTSLFFNLLRLYFFTLLHKRNKVDRGYEKKWQSFYHRQMCKYGNQIITPKDFQSKFLNTYKVFKS